MKMLVAWTICKLYAAIGAVKQYAAEQAQAGKTTLSAIASMMVTGLMVLVFIINIVPMIEALVVPETITNEFVATMLEMAIWVVPVGGVVALFVWIFKRFK